MADSLPQLFLDQSGCYTCFGASVSDALTLGGLAQIIRGGGTNPLGPAPVLINDAGRSIAWSTTGSAPIFARIEQSTDGINWTFFDQQLWTLGNFNVVSGYSYRVTGWSFIKATTLPSNTVAIALHATVGAAVTGWAARVVTNGGAAPSLVSKSAQSDYCYDADTAGITAKLQAVTFFAPDSLIACFTPLIKVVGNSVDPYANTGFVLADLSVNGLKGDGVAKKLNTGLTPFPPYAVQGSDAISAYCQGNTGTTGCEFITGNAGGGDFSRLGFCSVIYTTLHTDLLGPAGTESFRGYICISTVLVNRRDIYLANSTTPHASYANSVVPDAQFPAGGPMPLFCTFENPTFTFFTPKRLSFVAFSTGLTSADSLANYNAVVHCRTVMGGGLDTDPNIP